MFVRDGMLIQGRKQGAPFRMAIRQGLKWAARMLMAFMLLTVAAWSLSRWLGPTDAQDAALVGIRKIPPLNGENAFGALWLLPYDIPQAEQERVLAEDMRRLATASRDGSGESHPSSGFSSSAEQRYPKQSLSPDDIDLWCGGSGGCLQKVMADRERYAALLARHAAIIDRAESLSAYDGIRHPRFADSLGFILPPYPSGKLPATRYALDFVDGRRHEAFEGTCGAIATWRRLGANSDTLISRLIGTAYSADVYGRLFAEMLAETPRDFELPPACSQAFAATTAEELSMCLAMQGEFRFLESATRQIETGESEAMSKFQKVLMPLFYSADMTEAQRAELLSFYCGENVTHAMRTDRPAPPAPGDDLFLRFQCVGNPVGCLLSSIANPAFDPYPKRVQDANAKLRLIALLLRLRADTSDTRAIDVRLRASAADVGAPERETGIGPDGRTLRLKNYGTGSGAYWEIPLPEYFQNVSKTTSH
ncbi:MAG: hypothetical protein V4673_07325 [Pseudomonadota bacterium]